MKAAKIPIHIVRYEDIVKYPKQTLLDVVSFVLNHKEIKQSKIEHYIDIAVNEASPQIYKPREGKVNGNLMKYNDEQL